MRVSVHAVHCVDRSVRPAHDDRVDPLRAREPERQRPLVLLPVLAEAGDDLLHLRVAIGLHLDARADRERVRPVRFEMIRTKWLPSSTWFSK